jgi:hypothetical protein
MVIYLFIPLQRKIPEKVSESTEELERILHANENEILALGKKK